MEINSESEIQVTVENGVVKPVKRKRVIDFSKLPPLRSAAEIGEMNIPPLKHIVRDLITEGVGILAAREKMGKSWLCYQLGECVSKGQPFLGRETTQGSVLYVDLENARAVRQERINKMFGDNKPTELLFINPNQPEPETHEQNEKEKEGAEIEAPDDENEAYLIGDGFEEVLCSYLDRMNNPVMVIIDVLDKAVDSKTRQESDKHHAYRNIGRLKPIAERRHLAIICVMHYRKLDDPSDFLSNVSGSNGWTAAADYVLGLSRKRGDPDGVLQSDGRTCQGAELAITQDAKTLRWSLRGSYADVIARRAVDTFKSHPVTKAVLQVLEANSGAWSGTSQQLKAATIFDHGMLLQNFSAKQITAFINSNIMAFKNEYGVMILDKNENNSKTSQWAITKLCI